MSKNENTSVQNADTDLQEHGADREGADRWKQRLKGFSEHLLNTSTALVVVLDPQGRIVQSNRAFERISGYSGSGIVNKDFIQVCIPSEAEGTVRPLFRRMMNEGGSCEHVTPLTTQSGERRLIAWTNTVLSGSSGEVELVLGTGVEIPKTNPMEAALRSSESRYRSLFEDSAIALWEEDFSLVKLQLDQLQQLGVTDFATYFQEHPETVALCAGLIRVLDVNQAALDLFNAATKQELVNYFDRTMTDKARKVFQEELTILAQGRRFLESEVTVRTLDGEYRFGLRRLTVPSEHRDSLARVFVSLVDITKRKMLEEKLREMATTDSLTGILNRRSYIEQTDAELQRSKRYGYPLSIIFLDVDRFKEINDSYGHQTGDEVLVSLTRQCLSCLRENDLFGRIGGEEFAITLIESDLKRAETVAERLRDVIRETTVQYGQAEVRFTVSFGVAQLKDDEQDLDSLMARADKALYRAKKEGRDRVETG
ncbi:MAG: sensor domain-containing diguanylate cyclase [Desulfovibrionales bacterium]